LEVYGEYGGFSFYDNIAIPFIKADYMEKIWFILNCLNRLKTG
jgi:hypothetical protein